MDCNYGKSVDENINVSKFKVEKWKKKNYHQRLPAGNIQPNQFYLCVLAEQNKFLGLNIRTAAIEFPCNCFIDSRNLQGQI